MSADKSLLLRARRLEERALAEIYDRFSSGLYRYAVRLLGDSDFAEECVAETFSRFLHALHGGGGPKQHLQAYLYRVAHNWITDHYRSNRPVVSSLEPELQVNEDPGPLQTVQSQMEREAVREALTQLTSDQLQVIVLKFLEGWSNKEIAQTLDKSVGAVKALQHRALEALKRVLVREEEFV